MSEWLFWLIVILILSFIEVITINLVSVWFVASAIISLILSFFNVSFFIQCLVFVIGGVIIMVITRPLLKKTFKNTNEKTNFDRVIGMIGTVSEEIKKNQVGEVKVDGKKWSAISDTPINKGETVIVEEIIGVKLRVRKEDE